MGRRKLLETNGDWQSAKISEEAWKQLKLANAITGFDMREIASFAILKHCEVLLTWWDKMGKAQQSKKDE